MTCRWFLIEQVCKLFNKSGGPLTLHQNNQQYVVTILICTTQTNKDENCLSGNNGLQKYKQCSLLTSFFSASACSLTWVMAASLAASACSLACSIIPFNCWAVFNKEFAIYRQKDKINVWSELQAWYSLWSPHNNIITTTTYMYMFITMCTT